RCFGADTVEEILARLAAEKTAWAEETVAVLQRKSPTSLKVTLRQLRLGAKLSDFAAAMRMEYRMALHAVAADDFYHGVGAGGTAGGAGRGVGVEGGALFRAEKGARSRARGLPPGYEGVTWRGSALLD